MPQRNIISDDLSLLPLPPFENDHRQHNPRKPLLGTGRYAVLNHDGFAIVSGENIEMPDYDDALTQCVPYSPSPFQWKWFVVTWSLAIEEQFYLLAPIAVRWLSLRRLVWLLVGLPGLVLGGCMQATLAPSSNYSRRIEGKTRYAIAASLKAKAA